MLFTSLEFVFLYFPIAIGIYFLLPKSWRNYWLLVVSLFFYAWGEPRFVLVMLASIVLHYSMAMLIVKYPRRKKLFLILTIGANLSVLFIFKYLNFVLSSLNAVASRYGGVIPVTHIALPIGISFFTFQALSYVVDVYRGNTEVQRNICFLGLYISFFPQLIAGPIVRYTTIEKQIRKRVVTIESFSEGIYRFLLGFNKKMLIANSVAQVADAAFAEAAVGTSMAWLGALCYTLQIFFDFSGYSDMAIGLGRMFGFSFLENFDYPYISKTVTEFWRRWHISLSSWFRDYVYFPLGGSRVEHRHTLIRNLLIVWTLTGIWHGANWTFLLWGAFYGVIICIEKITDLPHKIATRRATSVLYQVLTMVVVMVGWVLFRADNISSAGRFLSSMFSYVPSAGMARTAGFFFREYFVSIIAGVLCSTPLFFVLKKKIASRGVTVERALKYIVQGGLFIISISFLIMNQHNPFIYFNF